MRPERTSPEVKVKQLKSALSEARANHKTKKAFDPDETLDAGFSLILGKSTIDIHDIGQVKQAIFNVNYALWNGDGDSIPPFGRDAKQKGEIILIVLHRLGIAMSQSLVEQVVKTVTYLKNPGFFHLDYNAGVVNALEVLAHLESVALILDGNTADSKPSQVNLVRGLVEWVQTIQSNDHASDELSTPENGDAE